MTLMTAVWLCARAGSKLQERNLGRPASNDGPSEKAWADLEAIVSLFGAGATFGLVAITTIPASLGAGIASAVAVVLLLGIYTGLLRSRRKQSAAPSSTDTAPTDS